MPELRTASPPPERAPAGLGRRLAAAAYDALLVAAILAFATVPPVALRGAAIGPGELWYGIYLAVIAFLYWAWPWTHGGQTLGMRSWRIELRAEDGGPVTWRQAAVRFAAAWLAWLPLGAGLLPVLWRRDRRAWHDRLSGTVVLRLTASGA